MKLNHLINNAQYMPNIPEIVQELIQSFGDENINADAISNKVNKDQSMTAKVLRMANSAKYGGHRNVGSINDAVVLLGFNALRTMVLASGLTSAFPTPEGFDIKEFWKKSFGVANISKWLAKFTPNLDAEIAYTCGMMYDIGGLLTHILVHEKAIEVDHMVARGGDRITTEEAELGFNYTEAGAELAYRWKFPEDIVEGIRYQLEPLYRVEETKEENFYPLAGIVYIAKYLYHNSSMENDLLIEYFPKDMASSLNMNTANIIDQLDEFRALDNDLGVLLD